MNDEQVYRAHRLIMGACHRGAISGDRAVQAAIDVAAGEDIGYFADLTGIADYGIAAAADVGLSDRVMDVLAHSHAQALKDAHQALDRGHRGAYGPGEFDRLFNPASPLSPDDEDDTAPTGPGHFTPPRNTRVSNQQHASAGGRDDADYSGLYGRGGQTYGSLDSDERELDPRQHRQPRASGVEREWMDEVTFRVLFGRDPKYGELDN